MYQNSFPPESHGSFFKYLVSFIPIHLGKKRDLENAAARSLTSAGQVNFSCTSVRGGKHTLTLVELKILDDLLVSGGFRRILVPCRTSSAGVTDAQRNDTKL